MTEPGTLMTAIATELPTVTFAIPMPGFSGSRQFVLVRLDDGGVLYSLNSVDDPKLRFLVIPPIPFFPEYVPEIDDETVAAFGADAKVDTGQLLVMLVVTPGEGLADATANLLAPIVIDQRSRQAVQVILSGTNFPLRARLVSE